MEGMKRLHRLWPTGALLLGAVMIFVAERSFAGGSVRWVLHAVGSVLLVVSALVRALEWRATRELAPAVLFFCSVGLVGAVLAYSVTQAVGTGIWASIFWGLCLTLLFSSLASVFSVESSMGGVAFNPQYEHRRVRQATERGLSFGLLATLLLAVNFLASQHDAKLRLGSGGRVQVSVETREAVEALEDPVKVWLFFSRASEVEPRVRAYLERLTARSSRLQMETVDHALAADLAVDLEVDGNGWVAVARGDVSEKIRIGTSDDAAEGPLRRLDAEFLKALIAVTTERRVAYFTRGHGERPERSTEGRQASVRTIRRQLEALQYEVKDLGLKEGLGEKVPEDASVVFILGPQQRFLPSEEAALARYLRSGGRLYLALDAGTVSPLGPLLSGVGLEFDPTVLASERAYVQLTQTRADRAAIATNDVRSHPATRRLARNRGLYTVHFRSGRLLQRDLPPGVERNVLIQALDGTFADADGSFSPGPNEALKRANLAAAVTVTSTAAGSEESEGRMVVLADVDSIADDLVQLIQGNALMFVDTLQWLQPDEAPVLDLPEETDVKIIHRKEEDMAIFYGTTFGMPALVLALGWFLLRRKRR